MVGLTPMLGLLGGFVSSVSGDALPGHGLASAC